MGNNTVKSASPHNAAEQLQTAAIQLRSAYKIMEAAGLPKADCSLVLWHEAKIWSLVGDMVTKEAS